LLSRRVVLQVDEVRGGVVCELLLLVCEGNLFVLEEFGLLFMLILSKELLSVLFHHFLGIGVVFEPLYEVFGLL
jgi:hypothetical protein